MTPSAKVATGLELAAEGFADLRRERAELTERLEANRAAFVGGEGRAMALRYQALRGRDARVTTPDVPRHLHDGLRAETRDVPAETARSLELYLPSGAGKAAPPALRRGLLARMLRLGP